LSLKTLYRKRTVIWPFYFYTIIRTLSEKLTIAIDSGLKAIYDSVIVVFPLKMLIERLIYV
ncbi:hypothetical protein, partial [Aerococcus urinaeequi]|uniref:hypothetical protein n=1 Tax=Aerococcus urinaeequi TaxID=51665 RepID=UPI002890D35F